MRERMLRLVGSGMLDVGLGDEGEDARGDSFFAEAMTRAATVGFEAPVVIVLVHASQAFRIWLMDFFRFFGYF